jgi:prepilin-type N-terminal cleavage/methylation domain-containing protein
VTRERQRGFSLVEITVAVAIIATIAVSGIAFSLAMRPTALWAATSQFDTMLSAARTIGAAYGDGATIYVSASPGPANFRADLYGHKPSASATPIATQVQPILANVAVSESQVLGEPPFAVILHGNGDIGVRKNFTRGDPVDTVELPCPASNQLVFVFTVNGQSATRTLPCHVPLAYTGPVTQIPPSSSTATSPPWVQPACDPTNHGCPISPLASAATPIGCPAGTIAYNGVCRAPLVLTVTGPTTASGQCVWNASLTPCAFAVSEQYYPTPNLFTAVSTSAAPCTANYTLSNGSGSGALAPPNSYTGPSPTTWSVTPQALDGSSCTLVIYDDRGPSDPNGSATLQISASNTATCPPGFTGTPPNCTQYAPPSSSGLYMIGGQTDTQSVSSNTFCNSNGVEQNGGICPPNLFWAWSFELVSQGNVVWLDTVLSDYAPQCTTGTAGISSCDGNPPFPDPGIPATAVSGAGAVIGPGAPRVTNIDNSYVTNIYYNDMPSAAQALFDQIYGASPPPPTPGPLQPTPCSQANSEARLC